MAEGGGSAGRRSLRAQRTRCGVMPRHSADPDRRMFSGSAARAGEPQSRPARGRRPPWPQSSAFPRVLLRGSIRRLRRLLLWLAAMATIAAGCGGVRWPPAAATGGTATTPASKINSRDNAEGRSLIRPFRVGSREREHYPRRCPDDDDQHRRRDRDRPALGRGRRTRASRPSSSMRSSSRRAAPSRLPTMRRARRSASVGWRAISSSTRSGRIWR